MYEVALLPFVANLSRAGSIGITALHKIIRDSGLVVEKSSTIDFSIWFLDGILLLIF